MLIERDEWYDCLVFPAKTRVMKVVEITHVFASHTHFLCHIYDSAYRRSQGVMVILLTAYSPR